MVNYASDSGHNWGWVYCCFSIRAWHIALRVCVSIKDHKKPNLCKKGVFRVREVQVDWTLWIVPCGHSVAKRPSRCFHNLLFLVGVPLKPLAGFICDISEFSYPVMLVNSQLVAFRQLEFLILLCYICSVNKQLDFHIAGMITLKLTSLP